MIGQDVESQPLDDFLDWHHACLPLQILKWQQVPAVSVSASFYIICSVNQQIKCIL
jgi:hypothetical protein